LLKNVFNCNLTVHIIVLGDENMEKNKEYEKLKKKYKKKYKKKQQKSLKSLMISTNNIVDNLNLIYTKIEQLKEGLNSEKK